jgi:CheY-like chemotaxis protein
MTGGDNIGTMAIAWRDIRKASGETENAMPEQDDGIRYRVLVAEDNPQHLELIETYLEAMPNVDVLRAANGIEALQAVQESMPDLVLLDIMMPKMSGFEVCKRIKSDPRTRDILVVMVTALNETGDVERAAECGTDDYLAKPVDRVALIDLIRNLLSARNKT